MMLLLESGRVSTPCSAEACVFSQPKVRRTQRGGGWRREQNVSGCCSYGMVIFASFKFGEESFFVAKYAKYAKYVPSELCFFPSQFVLLFVRAFTLHVCGVRASPSLGTA